MEMLSSLGHYVQAILVDGDWANDWVTHLPHASWHVVMFAGHMLANVVGR